MAFSINYTTLFEIIIYHDYFLDSGKNKFSALPEELKLQQLERYNWNDYFDIVPTPETGRILKNQRMLLRKGKNNFKVVASTDSVHPLKPIIPISEKLELHFMVCIKDRYFPNFTDVEQEEGRIFLFTNDRPATEPLTFPLMALEPVPGSDPLITELFLAKKTTSTNLIKGTADINPMKLFGMFVIRMKTDVAAESVIVSPEVIKSVYPSFKIQFQNRKRYWKYKKTSTNASAVTRQELPLTKYGFIEIDPETELDPPPPIPPPEDPDDPDPFYPNVFYPNPVVSALEKDGATTYSVIFI